MTRFHWLARSSALAAAGACAFAVALAGFSDIGEAKKAKAAPPAQTSNPSAQGEQPGQAAHQAYDAGLKEFANGHYQPAIEHFSTALTAGGLTAAEMAKALYTRGIAYKKQGKPGLAISDLTSALWLKNGLTPSERDKATQDRADAFKIAGIEDSGKGPERVIGSTSAPGAAAAGTANLGPNSNSAGLSAAAIAQAAASEGKSSQTAASGAPVTRQDPSSQSAQDAARARAAYASNEQGLQSAASATVVQGGAAAQPGTTTVTVSTPGDGSSSPLSSASSSVTGFFSSMFGGGKPSAAASPPVAEPAGVTTASTTSTAGGPAVSDWSQSTTVTGHGGSSGTGPSTPSAHTAAANLDKPATANVAGKGKYKIHIAALRSREAAEALAQKLVAEHGADLSNHAPTVDEAVIGSMGTFYRVRVGGYASQEEPQGVCNKLRSSGLDCLVVTN